MKSKMKKITAIMLCVMMLFSILPAPLFAAEGEEPIDSEIKVEEITVTSESDLVKVGETLVFYASVLPEDASDKSVTWTVTQATENATISEEGVLTAVSQGEVTVKATANDGSDVYGEKTIRITEEPVAVSEITVDSEEDIVLKGASLQMNVMVSPDNATDKSVTWSVTNGTGSAAISADGILTGEDAGEVTVKATANDGSGICGEKVITIKERVNIEKINLTVSSRYVGTYKDITIIKNIYPSNATNTDLTWTSSDTTIATVGDTGIVTTNGKSGTVTITAKAADGSNVKGSIQLEVGKNTIVVGSTSTFSARADYENVVWDIENPEIVEKVRTSYNYMSWLSSKPYDHGITLRGLQSGSSKVTMKTSSGTELATTTIYAYTPVSSITSDTKNIKFEVGDTYDLDIKISPENVDSEFSDIYYSSTDDTVASVDSTGKVTAKGLGSAKIVVASKYNNKKCTISVEVVKFAADIQLTESETTLTSENNVFQLEYILEPADATDKSATFKSSDESVAIVNKDGKIFAVGNGSAVITVTSGDGKQSKEFFVTVDNVVSMTGINIKDERIVVTTEGKIPVYQVQYELLPNDAANTGLIWKIANEDIATVDQTGKVTAVANGTTILTVKTADGRYSDNCDINVIKGYNKVTYLRVREYDSTSSSSNIIDHATAYYGEDFPVREDLTQKGYDFD